MGLFPAYMLLVPVVAYFLVGARGELRASQSYRNRQGLGGRTVFGRYWNAYRHYFAFGMTLVDRIAVIRGATDKFRIEVENQAEQERIIHEGKGMVILSAHCGNWEAAAHILATIDVTVNIVAYEGEREHVQKFFDNVLKDKAFNVIAADQAFDTSLQILTALQRGEVVAMLGDRTLDMARQDTVTVPFLGAPTQFPVGPHLVAAISGAPILHAFCVRTRPYHYRFHLYPPERLEFAGRDRRKEQLEGWVSRYVERLEDVVRRYPFQWNNFYEFWDE